MTTEDATIVEEGFDELLGEAIAIAGHIAAELADGQFPAGLRWGSATDMAETVRELRIVSDRVFGEGHR